MFSLSQLLQFDNIIIQCHDNPDADSIASAFGVYNYLIDNNKNAKIIYSGHFAITKPNLVEMIRALDIQIEYLHKLKYTPDLLITVDCQYGESNVTKFEAKNIAILDHHISTITNLANCEIAPYLGSCSTLIWALFKKSGYDFSKNINLSTALYYGLYSDTNGFSEIYHPLDKDMRDSLKIDKNIIRILQNSNLSLIDLETAGIALLRCSHNKNNKFAIFKAHPCDPNILGFISDLAIQVNTINTCLVYNETNNGIKFSVRSSSIEVKANEMAQFICHELGSAGGHINKAGGFISIDAFKLKFNNLNIEAFLLNRINEYYESFNIIYSNTNIDLKKFKLYKRKKNILGFIPSTELFSNGSNVLIRTLQGDIEITASNNLYLLIGSKGNVQPINSINFHQNYSILSHNFYLDIDYKPTVRNKDTNEVISLLSSARQCITSSNTPTFALKLDKNTKLFTTWDKEIYKTGYIGDYLTISRDDLNDMQIISGTLFHDTYEII